MTSPSTARTALQLLACVSGIYLAYLTQGIVQETLSTKRFGPDQARFPHLSTLNAFQSWACFLWAFVLMQAQAWLRPASPADAAAAAPPFTAYWRAAVTNCIGPACGFQALRYITYPAQVLAKSSKMIPVMVLGTLLHGKRYQPIEYLCCFAITGGVALFAARSSTKVSQKLAAPNAPLGYALCFANLMLDGYTNVAQDEIHRRYSGGTALHMMCWMNFWSGLFYLPLLFVVTSAGSDVMGFCLQHREAAVDVLVFCLCGTLGQLFIFFTIRTFGSLVNTLVTTTRKFFSILASVVWSGNPLLPQQWGAVSLVFAGLMVSTATKHRQRQGAARPKTL